MRIALFWVITYRVVVIPYPRFGTTYRSRNAGRNYLYSLRDNPQGCSSRVLRGGNIKSVNSLCLYDTRIDVSIMPPSICCVSNRTASHEIHLSMSSGSSPRATNGKNSEQKGQEWIRAILVINHMGIGAGDLKREDKFTHELFCPQQKLRIGVLEIILVTGGPVIRYSSWLVLPLATTYSGFIIFRRFTIKPDISSPCRSSLPVCSLKIRSSRMFCCVAEWVFSDVSKNRSAVNPRTAWTWRRHYEPSKRLSSRTYCASYVGASGWGVRTKFCPSFFTAWLAYPP